MTISLYAPTPDELAAAERLIEAFAEPSKYGRVYHAPAEDGDDEYDRQRDIALVEELREAAEADE